MSDNFPEDPHICSVSDSSQSIVRMQPNHRPTTDVLDWLEAEASEILTYEMHKIIEIYSVWMGWVTRRLPATTTRCSNYFVLNIWRLLRSSESWSMHIELFPVCCVSERKRKATNKRSNERAHRKWIVLLCDINFYALEMWNNRRWYWRSFRLKILQTNDKDTHRMA